MLLIAMSRDQSLAGHFAKKNPRKNGPEDDFLDPLAVSSAQVKLR